MFNKNHLGHELVKNAYKINRYYCEKCKTTVRFDDGLYSYLTDKRILMFYTELDITCDEMIIKELLE